MNTNIKIILISTICILLFGTVLFIAKNNQTFSLSTLPSNDISQPLEKVTTILLPDQVPQDLRIIWEAYSIINEDYINKDSIDPSNMSESAVDAMVESLNDKHTSYVPPEAFNIQNEDFEGKFGGIGAQVSPAPDGKGVIITKPLPNTPAEKAGIKAGDRIIAVDGVDATSWSVLEAVNKIRGLEGTEVVLTVEHVGSLDTVEITIIRGIIDQPSVFSYPIEETDFTRVKITQFTAETPNEFIKALKSSKDNGIILDLRGNPGGLLSATVKVASELIPSGIVTYEIDAR